jgi:hypothetical protein
MFTRAHSDSALTKSRTVLRSTAQVVSVVFALPASESQAHVGKSVKNWGITERRESS